MSDYLLLLPRRSSLRWGYLRSSLGRHDWCVWEEEEVVVLLVMFQLLDLFVAAGNDGRLAWQL
jgi:hypothetical protein